MVLENDPSRVFCWHGTAFLSVGSVLEVSGRFRRPSRPVDSRSGWGKVLEVCLDACVFFL